ncbi:MAG: preprotein translocase subunit SecY [Planctomycetota bacterium]|nr:preprotein translocase subunit SecY [Planctomycetota bacterium]MCZ6543862.1 preprotein translocase subunit SecY [Planctomycetota bacterium]MCZ6612172.1 preprotein translocase subunit SecY [Planctomycetota bacterium]MCZ6811220.1 preprotein translocase subunit SecY [Planctomycetota bacterium]MCZ6850341.1 preprotein translocase subunit SecY [Planctomycetota bacterium]
MLQALINIFRIPDLRNRVLFTLSMLLIYRIGFWIPLPGVDQTRLAEFAEQASQDSGGFGRFIEYASIFTGGDFGRSTIFGLGIMPYITAAIIFQLLQTAVPRLQELKKEGATGQQKITEWTRYATVGLCFIQSLMWLKYMQAQGLVQATFTTAPNNLLFLFAGMTALTAGSMFLMWLGEQIDKYGIGNGVSLILTAGIISRMPNAINWIVTNFDPSQQADTRGLGVMGLLFLSAAFVFVVAGAILITVAQRRIPIQQAKHTRGRKVYGGQRHYLPLRVNHAGVMPIIFASSLMIFPSAIFGWMSQQASLTPPDSWWSWWPSVTGFLANNVQIGAYPYVICEIILIYFFSYFWTTVVFSPEEMAKQLRDHGSFIPGLRPGPRTAEYLEAVMERVTYVGAGFLAIIAVIPAIVARQMQIPFLVASFLGGTGLLIVVSVGLDLIQRIEANLLMRNYSGFLSAGDHGRPQRIRGPRR